MIKVICPKCGNNDTALVKREPLSGGGYKKTYRCPRCSNVWTTKE